MHCIGSSSRLKFFFEKDDIRFHLGRIEIMECWYFCLHGNAFEQIVGFSVAGRLW